MNSGLAKCALALAFVGWVAAANERLELVPTAFAYFYAYALPTFAVTAAAIVLLGRAFKGTIATRRRDWHLVVFRAVPKHARAAFLVLVTAALAYLFLSTGGSTSAPSWEAASPALRSALFVGFSIPALIAWVALLASARAAS
jgi:hypothetical protein